MISNAAREPEICDLADFLNACGAKIHGVGDSTIIIEGVQHLSGCAPRHSRPDCGCDLSQRRCCHRGGYRIKDVIPAHLLPVIPALRRGLRDQHGAEPNSFEGTKPAFAREEHPDNALPRFSNGRNEAPIMTMTCLAKGTSIFVENIFESRYKHVGELLRLGANIKVEGRVAIVEGVDRLSGAPVEAADLRGGAALVVAGLAAGGITQVGGIHHIDRGYENIEDSFKNVGS